MSDVAVVLIARDPRRRDAALAALAVAVGSVVAVGGEACPWPQGSGVGYAVNAGVEAVLAADGGASRAIVTLDAEATWTAEAVHTLAGSVDAGAALAVAAGVHAPFAAAAFAVEAWRRAGGVDEGYLDARVQDDFARAVERGGGDVRAVAVAGATDGDCPDPPLRRRVRNELVFRARWSSPIRAWAWATITLLRGLPGAERGDVVAGLVDGVSWWHTRSLVERRG